jgi:organic radical activating enzyme
MIHKLNKPLFLVALFVTIDLIASENPLPNNLKNMQALSKKLREEAHTKSSQYKTLYNERSASMPKIPIDNKIKEKITKPMLKIQSLSEDIKKSKEHLKKVTVPLPSDEGDKYDSLPH